MLSGKRECHSDLYEGSLTWFAKEKGLNDCGFIPGIPQGSPWWLPESFVSKEHCENRWGKLCAGAFWYAKRDCCESPDMQRKIEELYEITHQRPMGDVKKFNLGFARGLIAEKMGYPVNWAAFAIKTCHRGGKSFESIESVKARCARESAFRSGNEATKFRAGNLPSAPDDWELNRRTWGPTIGRTEHCGIPRQPPSVVSKPLYKEQPSMDEEMFDAHDNHEVPRVNVRTVGYFGNQEKGRTTPRPSKRKSSLNYDSKLALESKENARARWEKMDRGGNTRKGGSSSHGSNSDYFPEFDHAIGAMRGVTTCGKTPSGQWIYTEFGGKFGKGNRKSHSNADEVNKPESTWKIPGVKPTLRKSKAGNICEPPINVQTTIKGGPSSRPREKSKHITHFEEDFPVLDIKDRMTVLPLCNYETNKRKSMKKLYGHERPRNPTCGEKRGTVINVPPGTQGKYATGYGSPKLNESDISLGLDATTGSDSSSKSEEEGDYCNGTRNKQPGAHQAGRMRRQEKRRRLIQCTSDSE